MARLQHPHVAGLVIERDNPRPHEKAGWVRLDAPKTYGPEVKAEGEGKVNHGGQRKSQ